MDQRSSTALLGYETPIRKALWNRITHLGAPRMMSYSWMMGSAWLALLVFNKWGFRWVFAVAALWALVQVLLATLTAWNPRFDDALSKRWSRRYQAFYPAG